MPYFSPALRREFFALFLVIALTPATAPHAFSDEKKEKHTPLGEEMEVIAKNHRNLRRQIADPGKKDSSLRLLREMEKRAMKAKELVPARARDVAGTEREKFVAAYQAKIDELVQAIQQIIKQVEGDLFNPATQGLSKLQGLKREGHEQFSVEDD